MSKVTKTKASKQVTRDRKAKPIKLSVIIVNYNVKEFLEQCLISIQQALKGIQSEIILIDNSSFDGSVEMVREKFPAIKLKVNTENIGFAKASNQGLQLARGEFIALINPDTIVQEDTFSKMLQFFDKDPETGMLGCKILNPDGSLQLACRRSFPTPWVAFTKLSGLSYLFPGSKLFGRYNLTYLDPEASHEVDAISGSFMMIRRKVLKEVGCFDESFFMYGEDLDWCFRIRDFGWKVQYSPSTQIVHFKGESSKRAQFDTLKMFYQAMELFARKHFKRRYLFMPYWLLRGAIWFRAGVSFFIKVMEYTAVPLTDFVALNLSLIIGIILRFGSLKELPSFVPVIIAYSVIWLTLLKLFGCYDKDKFSFSKAGTAIFIGFLVNTSLTFFFKQYAFSRAVVLAGSMLSLAVVPGWRLVVKIFSRAGWVPFKGTLGKTLLAKNTIIVGDIKSGEQLVKKFNSQIDSDYNISGLVAMNGESTGTRISGVTVLGAFDDINSIIRENHIQEVIFSTHELSYDQILGVISRARKERVNFKLIPSNLDVIIGKASIDRIDDVPLLEIDYKLHQTGYRVLKRVFDFILAFVLFLITLPLFFYKKFLTSGKLEKKFIYESKNKKTTLIEFDGGGSKIVNRIPFLWSILAGHLSFVGREIEEDFSEKNVEERLDLKPGLTGLQQINRHKNLSREEQNKYHLYYMKNYSPLLDLEILFKAFCQIWVEK